jgi:hypothetical protein
MHVKLMLQMAKQQSKPLYMIFLNLKEAYNKLDQTRTIQLLQQYGMGLNLS